MHNYLGTAMANTVLGQFHYEKSETLPPGNATKKQLRSAYKYYSESGRINLKVCICRYVFLYNVFVYRFIYVYT